MMRCASVIATIALSLLAPAALAQSQFESSKMSPGIVVEGSALKSSKISPGVVLENKALQSSKMSAGVVMENIALKSSKMSVGIVLQVLPSAGSAIPRAPLTHW